jgi:hypothetical protein
VRGCGAPLHGPLRRASGRAPLGHHSRKLEFAPWESVPAGALFLDSGNWPLVVNRLEEAPDGTLRVGRVSPAEERLVLRPGWDAGRWLRRARREGGSVEAVVGELDLRSADEIWCRNRAARSELVARGFDPERVRAVRVPVETWP